MDELFVMKQIHFELLRFWCTAQVQFMIIYSRRIIGA